MGRLCNLKGTPTEISSAFNMLTENIIKLETTFNGVRKDY